MFWPDRVTQRAFLVWTTLSHGEFLSKFALWRSFHEIRTTLWRIALYGENMTLCNFMVDKLYGEQEFPKFGKNNNFMAEVTLW